MNVINWIVEIIASFCFYLRVFQEMRLDLHINQLRPDSEDEAIYRVILLLEENNLDFILPEVVENEDARSKYESWRDSQKGFLFCFDE